MTGAKPVFTVVGVPDRVGEAAAIFKALADAEINVDMIVQNVSAASTSRTDISFTLPADSGQNALAALKKIQDKVGFESLLYNDRIGKVSLIGAGMRSYPGVTARFFLRRGPRGHQHRDHFHFRDPHLDRGGAGRRGRRSGRRAP